MSRRLLRNLAANDGRKVAVDGACCDLHVVIGVHRIQARHDDGCPALDPTTEAGLRARLQADQAVALVVEQLVGGTVVPVVIP